MKWRIALPLVKITQRSATNEASIGVFRAPIR